MEINASIAGALLAGAEEEPVGALLLGVEPQALAATTIMDSVRKKQIHLLVLCIV
jgi:hypothetical protein